MKITIAICTWNRCELLERTLHGLTQMVIPPDVCWDVLVVDNNCTDATPDVVVRFARRLPITRVFEPTPGKAHACNRVVGQVTSDYILWTDDDVLVDERWFEAFVRAAAKYPTASVFGGPIEPWFLQPPDPDLLNAFPILAEGFCGLEQSLAEGPVDREVPVWGANMAFRRDAVAHLKFNTSLGPSPTFLAGGEEADFIARVQRQGGVLVWCPNMRVKHCVAPSRATLAYLSRFTEHKGLEYVKRVKPQSTGHLWFGAPKWLWRQWGDAAIRALACWTGLNVSGPSSRWSGPPPVADASPRAKYLATRREQLFIGGMLKGFRSAQSGERAS
jgi:GT2 family glycosyltransferase